MPLRGIVETLTEILTLYGPIAQSVEQLAFNQWVGSSNLPRLNLSSLN